MRTDKTTWIHIRNYESFEIVKNIYQDKHGRIPSTDHAREIASQFTQARSYFDASFSAEMTIKPPLQYYGIIGLSRGLVLFLNRGLREATLAQSHGLSSRDWSSALGSNGGGIHGLTIEVNQSGTFCELTAACGNRNLLRVGSSGVNKKTVLGSVPAGSRYTLSDILCRSPEVVDSCQSWKTPLCIPISTSPIDPDGRVTVTVDRKQSAYVNQEYIFALFGPERCQIISDETDKVVVKIGNGSLENTILTDKFQGNTLGIGDAWLSYSYPNGGKLSGISQMFAASFLIGTLARYHPTLWMGIVHRRYSDSAVPVLFHYIELIQERFPAMVLDFLEEQDL